MYEEKLRKEIDERMVEYFNLCIKIKSMGEAIKRITGLSLSHEDLIAGSEDYANTEKQIVKLHDKISLLLVETKYFPLIGLSDSMFKVLRIVQDNINSTFGEGDAIEKFLDGELENLKCNAKRRLLRVKPLYLTAHIDPWAHRLYTKVVRCYVCGLFEASCVLCRAIVETKAKGFIDYKGYGHLLVGKNKKDKTLSITDILLNFLGIDKSIVVCYNKITRKANYILHAKKGAEEEDAFEAINLLKEYIEKFPACK